ncbi:hypothetical protein T11_12935 [Trichinella zimbabwensis]|uniref:Uncharacterized protein n=1 Tax=Trichinella zimbabwensis TaxID=268475 RepID=A0A0V1GLU3_9BILA|nr:hypothetical protein T11_12935 [Trichinella zimbabwensis]
MASDVECRVLLCFSVAWRWEEGLIWHCTFLMFMGSNRILLFRSWFPFELRFAFALHIGFTCIYQIEEKPS